MKNLKIYFFCFISIVFICLALPGCSSGEEADFLTNQTSENETETSECESQGQDIYVYITGCVKNPGVYKLSQDARLYEAVDLAGGFKNNAGKDYINLAQKVEDGQHIVIASKKEYEESQNKELGDNELDNQESDGQKSDVDDTCADSGLEDGLVNINTADETELMTLDGIGQVKADAIIAYRQENGDFASIEDIMLVPGIKEASYSMIESKIKVR